jgi:hypothetical protein
MGGAKWSISRSAGVDGNSYLKTIEQVGNSASWSASPDADVDEPTGEKVGLGERSARLDNVALIA